MGSFETSGDGDFDQYQMPISPAEAAQDLSGIAGDELRIVTDPTVVQLYDLRDAARAAAEAGNGGAEMSQVDFHPGRVGYGKTLEPKPIVIAMQGELSMLGADIPPIVDMSNVINPDQGGKE